jgi:adenylate cyclase
MSRTVRDHVRDKLDLKFEDRGEHSFKNISRPVRVFCIRPSTTDATPQKCAQPAAVSADKPSIAVLSFDNLSGDIEQEYFADGIAEDIITALSKWQWILVIARNSSFVYKGKSVSITQIGRELGAQYVLEGSVRRSGSRLRITGQLIDAPTGNHVWAERYDRDLADVFAVQDEITDSVVAAIEPAINKMESERATRKNPVNLGAYDFFQRGMWHLHKFNAADNDRALKQMREAIRVDPEFARGYMGLSRAIYASVFYRWSDNVSQDIADAAHAARRAVDLDDRDPYCHYMLAATTLAQRDHKTALSAARRAIDLSPNFALGYLRLGQVCFYYGRFEEAIAAVTNGLRLNPQDPQGAPRLTLLALARYHLGQYDEAVRLALEAKQLKLFPGASRVLAASYAQIGRLSEAREAYDEWQRLIAANPRPLWETLDLYADPAHPEHLRDGLRKASGE